MQYKYSIIEGKQSTIKKIEKYFEDIPEYKCVGVSNCKDQSLDTILEHIPDLVFINVDQDKSQSIDSFVNDLHKYCKEMPQFIAMSKNQDQAFTCLKNGFFDYLITPIHTFDLRKAMSRLNLKPKVSLNTLCLKSNKEYRFIDLDEILFLKADSNNTDFRMNDGSSIGAYQTLKSFEDSLPKNFIRIHNSYIVNQDYVTRINFGRTKSSINVDSFAVPFSKSYKNNVVIIEQSLSKKSIVTLN